MCEGLCAMGGFKYFITFINGHSRFGCVGLLTKKFEALDTFKEKIKATIEL